MADVDLSTRTLGQLLNMFVNGTITLDELTRELGRRAQMGELLNLRGAADRAGITWEVIDPFGEIQTALHDGRIGQVEFDALTTLVGQPPDQR